MANMYSVVGVARSGESEAGREGFMIVIAHVVAAGRGAWYE